MQSDIVDPKEFKELLDFAYSAHQEHCNEAGGRGKTMLREGVPFIIHPIWCALTLLMDNRVPFEERRLGYQALLLHDVLEDTTLPLPEDLDPKVRSLVEQLTCETWEEEKDLEGKQPLFYMLKLIDKLWTTYTEGVRQDPERRRQWLQLNRDLLAKASDYYPNARIVKFAEAIIGDTNW